MKGPNTFAIHPESRRFSPSKATTRARGFARSSRSLPKARTSPVESTPALPKESPREDKKGQRTRLTDKRLDDD